MSPVLLRNTFFVKEHVGMFKSANNYDILDPESQQIIMTCREEKLGFITKMLRFTDYKKHTPFDIEIKIPNGDTIVRVKRGVSIFLSKIEVLDSTDQLIGTFKQKLFSIGGKFDVLDPEERVVCKLKGKWTSWDFKFLQEDKELAQVTKKWAGLGKELFTSADNYILNIQEEVTDENTRKLILAAVMCIDMVLKE